MNKLVFFDVETTGLEEPEIIQLYASGYDSECKSVSFTIDSKFSASKPISVGAMATHHITEAGLEKFNESKVLGFLNPHNIYIAHNAEFDVSCIARYGINPEKFICTMHCAKAFFKNEDKKPESYSLQYLRYFIGFKFSEQINPHDAKSDVIVLKALFDFLHTRFSPFEMLEITKEALKPENFEFRFGKHSGKTIKQVAQIDRSYLTWAVANMNGDTQAKIRQFLGIK